jgi:HD-GYP domain-containing protein (c-di-GMP phosphodiesterase class II)
MSPQLSDINWREAINISANLNFQKVFETSTNNIEEMVKKLSLLIEKKRKSEEYQRNNIDETCYPSDLVSILHEEVAAMEDEPQGLINNNKVTYLEVVRSLARAIEAKDIYTGTHSERVKKLSLGIGKRLNLNSQNLLELEYGSILHDIGKIGIPEKVLNKKSRLIEEEYALIKTHPLIGYEILKEVDFLKNSQRIALEHHERIDGKGYPFGLIGEDINILARIVSVADAFDAMTSSRAYRETPLSKKKAMKVMLLNKGTQFDPTIVDVLIKWLKE